MRVVLAGLAPYTVRLNADGNSQGDLMVSWESGFPLWSYMNDASWDQTTTGPASARSIARLHSVRRCTITPDSTS